MKTEIAVTGMCVLSGAGETVSALCQRSIAGNTIAPQIDLRAYESELDAVNTGAHELYRIQKLLLAAFLRASKMSGVFSDGLSLERIGIFLGNSYGLEGFKSEFFRLYKKNDPALTSPTLFPFTTANALGSWLAIQTGAKGPNLTFVSGCTSSSQAVLAACDALVSNECDAAFVGGVNLIEHDLRDELCACGFRYESAVMLVLEKMNGDADFRKRPLALLSDWLSGAFTQEQVREIASGRPITDVDSRRFNNHKAYPFELLCLGNNLGEDVFTYDKGDVEISSEGRKIFSLGNAIGNMFDASGAMGVALGVELLNIPQKAGWNSFDSSENDVLFSNIDSSGSAATMVISKNSNGDNDGGI